jgi:nicotinamidase-related amidase
VVTERVRGLEPGSRPAVVISELQRGIVDPAITDLPGLADHVTSRQVPERIGRLAEVARRHDVPVIWSLIEPRADRVGTSRNSPLSSMVARGNLVAGTATVAIAGGLTVQPQDVVISRVHGLTPFHGTDLDPILRALRVTTVVLAGVSTNVALTGAAIEAVNRGYQVVLPADCTAGSSPEAHARHLEEFFSLMGAVTDGEAVAAAFARLDREATS